MDIDVFLNLFRQALSQVEETYYGIDQQNNPILARHDERVFCYELYHQVWFARLNVRQEADMVQKVIG